MSARLSEVQWKRLPETQTEASPISVGDEKSGSHCACAPPQIPPGLQKTPASVQSALDEHASPLNWALTRTPERTEAGEYVSRVAYRSMPNGLTARCQRDSQDLRERVTKVKHVVKRMEEEIGKGVDSDLRGDEEKVRLTTSTEVHLYTGLLSCDEGKFQR